MSIILNTESWFSIQFEYLELKMDEKKQLILQTAMKLIAEVGYHKAKITKIAERAGIGAGTIYLYFSSKEAIIEEIFIEAWTIIETMIKGLAEDEKLKPDEKIRELIAGIVRLAMPKPELSRLILSEHAFWSASCNDRIVATVGNVRSRLESILSDGIEKGCFRHDMDCTMSGSFIIGGLWHTISFILDSRPDCNIDTIHLEIYSFVSNGINKLK